MNSELEIAKLRYQKYHTNHVLHLLLTIVSAGLWIPIWLLVAISNANERRKAMNIIKQHGGEE